MLFQRFFAPLLAACTAYTSIVAAADPPASTFFLSETETQFSLNIANDSQDVFLHFESPAYSWVAVGFGEKMQGSLMFIMYPSSNGQNVTISTRIGTGHVEPVHAPEIQLETLPGTGIINETFVLKAVCHNCRNWNGGFLAPSSSYPMIYAFGPGNALQSDSPVADLKRHIRYGRFNMNLQLATGTGGVPASSSAVNGVDVGSMTKDHDSANLAHAVLGCIAIFVLWPLNMIFAGFLKKAGIHIGFSIFTVAVLIISYSLGISASGEYNRSKSFNSAHQILAFITILPILLMSILPIRPIFNLSEHMPRIHRTITSLTYVFLVLVGGLGLHLSSQVRPIILVYTVISLFVFALLFLLQTIIAKRGSRIQRYSHRPSVHSNKSIGSWTSWKSGKWSRSKKNAEEDEQDLVLAAYYAGQKSRDHDRSGSVTPDSQRSGSQGNPNNMYGGGQMPGPQYLLNMHPGVPVHFR